MNTVLEYLNIDGTLLPAQSLIAFATVLQGNRTVKHFLCSNNFVHSDHVSSTIYDDVVQHMFKMVDYNESLVHLSLSKMAIKDRSIMDLLSLALKANKTLVELDLSSNKIMGDGGCAIAKAVRYHPRLMILNLSHNQIQDDGAIAISEMLLLNNTLKK